MIRQGQNRLARLLPGLAVAWGAAAWAQAPALPVDPAPGTAVVPAPTTVIEAAPGGAVLEAAPEAGVPVLPPDVQIVRFQAPAGVKVDILGPQPEPVASVAGPGMAVGLKVGVGYRLKLTNLPGRPDAELYPVVEVVGHLHRPPGIDPSRFPIRVIFGEDDLEESAALGRLVTQVVYLEDPEQAVPLNFPKSEIPRVSLSPAEQPLKVASALGRVMAIVRIGGRAPTVDEFTVGPPIETAIGGPCPFVGAEGARCPLPCGPATGTPPPAGRPWVPADEYLCDGGDHGTPAHFGGDGALRGIDPKDAMIRFRRPTMAELQPDIDRLKEQLAKGEISAETFNIQAGRLSRSAVSESRPRVLPTNMVCLYAPRFAAVRSSVGPNEALTVSVVKGHETIQGQAMNIGRTGPIKLRQNLAAEANRHRMRPSAMKGRVYAGSHIEIRVLGSQEGITHIAGFVEKQGPEIAKQREAIKAHKATLKPVAIKTAETAVVTGIVQGANESVMAWKPQEIAGVEEPPNKPGLAVVKRLSASEAEPGDEVTFTIQYRNMGNAPIASVSVVDSLLPRLEYLVGSAVGPKGTVFSAEENRAGSTELRWDLPGVIAPGAEGSVSFRARVR